MKKTAVAHTNIAFIKYWGKKDSNLRLPYNGSISMNLSNLYTTTTVEFSDQFRHDSVEIDGKEEPMERDRVIAHLGRIRNLKKVKTHAHVVSKNTFPSGTGLSSSASGFAALTLAGTAALGISLSQRELSCLARLASGSACRSIPSGFVEWVRGDTHEESYAYSLYPPDWWDILDVVVMVRAEKKYISSTKGQTVVTTSSFWTARLKQIEKKIIHLKKSLQARNFTTFGSIVEAEAFEMHAVMMTSTPALFYWLPETVLLLRSVRLWRSEGISVYATVNTGHDVHLICEKKTLPALRQKLKHIGFWKQSIVNYPAVGAYCTDQHLF